MFWGYCCPLISLQYKSAGSQGADSWLKLGTGWVPPWFFFCPSEHRDPSVLLLLLKEIQKPCRDKVGEFLCPGRSSTAPGWLQPLCSGSRLGKSFFSLFTVGWWGSSPQGFAQIRNRCYFKKGLTNSGRAEQGLEAASGSGSHNSQTGRMSWGRDLSLAAWA